MTDVRPAKPDDVPQILGLIRGLAAYEREPDAVRTTTVDLQRALFPREGAALVHCHVAGGRELTGMALWFVSFSTWEGRHGLHLEDLFVLPQHRGQGIGRALLAAVAAQAVSRGCARLEWSVLDWNTPARRFYQSLGARPMGEWVPYRLTGPELRMLASGRAAPA